MLSILVCMAITRSLAQGVDQEKMVRAYYSGFETHDWNKVAGQLATNFTFTSPNNDNHISLARFKAKCWPTNKFFKKINLIKIAESGNNVFLLVEITTTDNQIVRNVDFFSFDSGKIRSIETYFGPGAWFPSNKK